MKLQIQKQHKQGNQVTSITLQGVSCSETKTSTNKEVENPTVLSQNNNCSNFKNNNFSIYDVLCDIEFLKKLQYYELQPADLILLEKHFRPGFKYTHDIHSNIINYMYFERWFDCIDEILYHIKLKIRTNRLIKLNSHRLFKVEEYDHRYKTNAINILTTLFESSEEESSIDYLSDEIFENTIIAKATSSDSNNYKDFREYITDDCPVNYDCEIHDSYSDNEMERFIEIEFENKQKFLTTPSINFNLWNSTLNLAQAPCVKPQGFLMGDKEREVISEAMSFARESFPMPAERKDWKDAIDGMNKNFSKFNKMLGQSNSTAEKLSQDMSGHLYNLGNMARALPDSYEREMWLAEVQRSNSNFEKFLEKFNYDELTEAAYTTTRHALNKAGDSMWRYATITFILGLSAYVYKTRDYKYLGIIAAGCCYYIYNWRSEWAWQVLSSLLEWFISDAKEPEAVKPQNASGYTVLASVLSMIGCADSKKALTTEMYDKIANLGRVENSLNSIFSAVIEIVQWFTNIVRENVLNLPTIRFFDSNNADIDQYLKRLDSIMHKINQGDFLQTEDHYTELIGLKKEGEYIFANVPNNPNTRNILTSFDKELNKLRKIINDWENANIHLRGLRIETTTVLLRGGAGVGKSTTMIQLSHALVALNMTEEQYEDSGADPTKFMYNRAPETEYWDGYWSGAIVVYIDDFGQALDVSGQPDNEFMNLIRIANGFETCLHMSKIEDKGKFYFRSPFLLMSTNMTKLETNSLRCVEALVRRMIVDVCVTVNLDYCTEDSKTNDIFSRKLDLNKLPTQEIDGEKVTILTPDVQEYWLVDADGKVLPKAQAMNFDQLVQLTQSEYIKRKSWYRANKNLSKETFEKYRKKYVDKIKTVRPQSASPSTEYLSMFDPYESSLNTPRASSIMDTIYEETNSLKSLDASSPLTKYNNWIKKIPKFFIYLALGLLTAVVVRYIAKAIGAFLKWMFPAIYKDYIFQIDQVESMEIFDDKKDEWIPFEKYVEDKPNFKEHFINSVNQENWTTAFDNNISLYRYNDEVYVSQSRMINLVQEKDSVLHKYFSQSFGNSSKSAKKGKTTKKNYSKILESMKATPQSCDPTGVSIKDKVFRKNMVFLEIVTPTGLVKPIGGALGICDRFLLLNRHFLLSLASEYERIGEEYKFFTIRITKAEGKMENFTTVGQFVKDSKHCKIGEYDLAITKLPEHFPAFCDIRKNISTLEDHDKLEGSLYCEIPTVRGTTYSTIAFKYTRELNVTPQEFDDYTIPRTFFYKADTQDGDCGSPMFIMNPRVVNRKIYALHSAGDSRKGEGYATPLFLELIQSQIDVYEVPKLIDIVLPDVDFYEDKVAHPQNGMLYLGTMYNYPKRIVKQTLTHSKLEGVYEKTINAVPYMKPFINDKGEKVDPMLKAQSKYSIPRVPLDIELTYEIAENLFANLMAKATTPITPRQLTIHEAIFGYETVPYLRPVKMSTSPGYPMNMSGVENLKFLFTKDQDKYLPIMIELVEDDLRFIDQGKMSLALHTDTLKMEKLPIHKVLDGKARGFNIVPIIRNISQRVCFGAFVAWCAANSTEFGFSSGMNCYSDEWDRMYRSLAQFDKEAFIATVKVLTGDYSSYDGSISNELLHALYKIIEAFYQDAPPAENFRRKVLWNDLLSSVHIVDGRVYLWSGNNTSGNFMTFFLNCLVNVMIMMYCWYRATGSLNKFFVKVCLKVGGDDSIQSVSHDYREVYNGLTIPIFAKEIGITFTTESKGESVDAFKNIQEVEFLKRTFRKCNKTGKIVAPLRYEVIKDIPLWTQTYDNDDKIIVDNVRTSMEELSLWHDNNDNLEEPRKDYRRLILTFKALYPGLDNHEFMFMSIDACKRKVRKMEFILPDM